MYGGSRRWRRLQIRVEEAPECERASMNLYPKPDDLACICLELMQGGGCLAADPAFVRVPREEADKTGAFLMFEQVIISRAAVGGTQSGVVVVPDIKTVRKRFGGGSLHLATFMGKAPIMELIDPSDPHGILHRENYNNTSIMLSAMFSKTSRTKLQRHRQLYASYWFW
ncbi:uncharacterized protein BHQ10_009344 [Talaromyces amestolkiae]|uniref:Uncharacterized protein n=1 Tax=Talaromyces amestolkiae TaxID=1196081 RepID=A0A364LC04_TALAM|nr:uncharacterized protein BHQ10_009344 [Talaromyces amestolkiae]RAO73332.1 hypothetical protein BHQ10_009344 [Talaromyces amestolkiae]